MAELVHFLVPDSEISRWREEAHALGLSLTTLVRARMNGTRSSNSPLRDKAVSDAARQPAPEEVRGATLGPIREDTRGHPQKRSLL